MGLCCLQPGGHGLSGCSPASWSSPSPGRRLWHVGVTGGGASSRGQAGWDSVRGWDTSAEVAAMTLRQQSSPVCPHVCPHPGVPVLAEEGTGTGRGRVTLGLSSRLRRVPFPMPCATGSNPTDLPVTPSAPPSLQQRGAPLLNARQGWHGGGGGWLGGSGDEMPALPALPPLPLLWTPWGARTEPGRPRVCLLKPYDGLNGVGGALSQGFWGICWCLVRPRGAPVWAKRWDGWQEGSHVVNRLALISLGSPGGRRS